MAISLSELNHEEYEWNRKVEKSHQEHDHGCVEEHHTWVRNQRTASVRFFRAGSVYEHN